MDYDIAGIIEFIIFNNGAERDIAIDALYEELKRENMPLTVLNEICDLLIDCQRHNATAWFIASNLYSEIEAALDSENYDSLLNEVKKSASIGIQNSQDG